MAVTLRTTRMHRAAAAVISRLISRVDLDVALTAGAALLLMAVGLYAIHLAEQAEAGSQPFTARQAVYAGVALVVLVVVGGTDYRKWGSAAYPAFGVTFLVLGLLVVDRWIDIPGIPEIRNTRRWIRLGPVQLQPSELAKLSYILALGWYLRYRKNYRTVSGLMLPLALTLLPMGLILLEPDLGTVLLMLPVFFVMLFAAGARRRHLLMLALMCLAALPGLYGLMHGYQKMRLLGPALQVASVRGFLLRHPAWLDVLDLDARRLRRWSVEGGYQLDHSKVALATGGLRGARDLDIDCLRYNFLPDRHNDFIFAVIGHKWGLLGCVGVLACYAAIVTGGCRIAGATNEPFGKLLAVGVVSLVATQTLINVGMTVGLVPITGMTLPFVSYGGSSLLVNSAGIGLLVSIALRRPIVLGPEPFVFAEPTSVQGGIRL